MLSINFSTPLAGAARSERIKQMTNNHPAFEKARSSNEILVKIQTSLRRMPGVSAKESGEIIAQLQEVGQTISQETSQLVDALMNLQLDQEETDKAIARMSIEANLAKAEAEDQTQNLGTLKVEMSDEKDKRKSAEAQAAKVKEELRRVKLDFAKYKERGSSHSSNEGKSPASEETIKKLEATIEHLEGQVNNRRSLWVMKHSSPKSVARAIETMADSCDDKEAVHKSIMSLRGDSSKSNESNNTQDNNSNKKLSHVFSDLTVQTTRPSTSFQPSRSSSFAPPRFGPLTSGPPRPGSVMGDRRPSSNNFGPPHAPAPSRFGAFPGSSSSNSNNNNSQSMAPYGRAPSRRGFHHGSYRPNMSDLYHHNMNVTDNGFRSESAFSHRQGYNAVSPTITTTRNKYARFRDPVPPEFNAGPYNAMSQQQRRGGSSSTSGALIHLNDVTINAWNEQVMELYGAIRAFVDHNAGEPDFANPEHLAQKRIWPVLLAVYHPLSESECMSYLQYHLKDQSSKSCLVTRIIIDFIVNRVWVPIAWLKAHPDTDASIGALERDMEQTRGQPSSLRQPLLDRQASIIDTVLKMESFGDFSQSRIDEVTNTLANMVSPFMNEAHQATIACRDLEAVANLAWALSSRILTSRLTFDFRFPEVGARFSCQSMVPIWPSVDPMELQARHWRVALVTTPVITCRNDTGANISAHSVSLADVVCMQ